MYPKSLCRSIVAPTSNLSERWYALRLALVPCQYFPNLSLFLQPILSSPLSHIYSVSVPHFLRRHIYPCCPTFLTQCLSAAVFTADFVCHPHYPASSPRLHCHPPMSLLQLSSHYLPLSRVHRRRCLSTFSDQIFSSLCFNMYCSACSTLIHTNFLTLRSDLLTTVLFSFLDHLFSVSVMFSFRSDMPYFSPLYFNMICSNLIILLISICSDLLAPSLICSTLIAPLMIWSTCSDLLWSSRLYLLCLSFLCTF